MGTTATRGQEVTPDRGAGRRGAAIVSERKEPRDAR